MIIKEEQRYGRNKSTAISYRIIMGGQYKKKFDTISTNTEINKLLYSLAKKMLVHRSGTLYEDMYWIDTEKVKVVCAVTDSIVESRIEYTNRIKKIVENQKGLMTIHSHPNSFPPSLDDFNSAYTNGYSVGIVCGHNGDIFIYQSKEIVPESTYYYLMNEFIKSGQNICDAQINTLNELSKRYDIRFRKVGV